MNFETLTADVDKILSTHYTSGRSGRSINKIVLHHNDGNLTVEGCWQTWQTRPASAHYQVESSGRIGQLVWDRDTAWHAGNWGANLTSIGIEHADASRSPYRVSDACLESGAHLVAALCKFYKLGRPQWHVNVFEHRDFASTECAASLGAGGSQHDEYMRRAQWWYDQMDGKGGGAKDSNTPKAGKTEAKASGTTSAVPYTVKVTADALNVREGPGTSYAKTGCIRDKGTYTIVEEKGGWGRLKSGLGWIKLSYTKRSGAAAKAAASKKSVDAVAREVIAGKWGNGAARKSALEKSGYEYAAVQKRVNELLK